MRDLSSLKKAVKSTAVGIDVIFWSIYHNTANVKNKFCIITGGKFVQVCLNGKTCQFSQQNLNVFVLIKLHFLGTCVGNICFSRD